MLIRIQYVSVDILYYLPVITHQQMGTRGINTETLPLITCQMLLSCSHLIVRADGDAYIIARELSREALKMPQ